MKVSTKVLVLLFSYTLLVFLIFAIHARATHAMQFQEVKPYVFAELPHGRVYKAVHEGCELYIIESEGGFSGASFSYQLVTGKGCH